MENKPPLIAKLEEAVFFFKEKYGFAPEAMALSKPLVKALYRILKKANRLPDHKEGYELLGCEVCYLDGNSTKPWQFMLQTIQGGSKYQQIGTLNFQELGVTDVKKIIHDGTIKLEYDESVPEMEFLTGELLDDEEAK